MSIENIDAIRALVPDAEMVYSQGVVTQWVDERTQPTDEEIAAKKLELQAEYDAKEYARARALEYPSIADQLDDIFHNGLDGWKATIQETKDKYPKP
tara:strand:+ start:582 stop:872 length:291 start_codon:yes stop_codon:yes gene_type:complete